MNKHTGNIIVDSIASALDVSDEDKEVGITEFLPVGGLFMLACFFLVGKRYRGHDGAAYLAEIERLKAAKEQDQELRDEWLRWKYESLKVESGMNLATFHVIDAHLYPKKNMTLEKSVEALGRSGRNDPSPI